MNTDRLSQTIEKMFPAGKGILAIDESIETANKKRLIPLGIEPTEENRRKFRDLFLATGGIEEYLSGVILFDETLRQVADSGKSFLDILKEKDIAIGIKVDEGSKPSELFPGEEITSGLGTLALRLDEYVQMGAVFCKWRAVVRIDQELGFPTEGALRENCQRLARYAEICQQKGLVPMVEPEVLLEGSHSLATSREVLERVLDVLFEELVARGVSLPHLVLKTSMVLPGSLSGERVSPQIVAEETVSVLRMNVPRDAGGIVFLSGGQTHEEATDNLREIGTYESLPWPVTFSYARAIQGPVLDVWDGEEENRKEAQKEYLEILRKESQATLGKG